MYDLILTPFALLPVGLQEVGCTCAPNPTAFFSPGGFEIKILPAFTSCVHCPRTLCTRRTYVVAEDTRRLHKNDGRSSGRGLIHPAPGPPATLPACCTYAIFTKFSFRESPSIFPFVRLLRTPLRVIVHTCYCIVFQMLLHMTDVGLQ